MNPTSILRSGGVIVSPTDTVFGLLGNALNPKTVERIYDIKSRNLKKPFIILISHPRELSYFGVKLDPFSKKVLNKVWPGKVSVILPITNKKFKYLTRGEKALAFRLPNNKKLINLIKSTGPLVAPSANPEGKPPAKNVREAKVYFGNRVDDYLSGRTSDKPSTLIKIEKGYITVLREGAVVLKNLVK